MLLDKELIVLRSDLKQLKHELLFYQIMTGMIVLVLFAQVAIFILGWLS